MYFLELPCSIVGLYGTTVEHAVILAMEGLELQVLLNHSTGNDHPRVLSPAVVSLQPYCDQIDQVEASVSALEQTAYSLDAYCKRLGELFTVCKKVCCIY